MTRLSTSTVNHQPKWRCSDFFGQRPYAASCEDAVRRMAFIPPGSDNSRVFVWGNRDWPAMDVPLPQAAVSSDGHCRIDVNLRGSYPEYPARASQSQVQAGASAVIDNCVKNQVRPLGGIATHISDDGFLEVRVATSDELPEATCYGRMRPNAEASCKWVLDHMPAYPDEEMVFGFRDDPDAVVHIPWILESPDHRCALTVRTAGLSDSITWGVLWEFAVDLAGTCARRGMQGREIRLGAEGHLAMFLTDPSNDDNRGS